jgi:hypothetical protein
MRGFYSPRKKGHSRRHFAKGSLATTASECLGHHLRWVWIAPGHGRILPPAQGVSGAFVE